MNFLSISGIAVALAADAFAVSLATGISRQKVGLPLTLRMACVFGGFQFFMPVLGWIMGAQALTLIGGVDHWVAFGLLAFVGVKMVREGLSGRGKAGGSEASPDPVSEGRTGAPDPASGSGLLLLGVATSLDALAVGLSLAVLRTDIWFPAAVIGIVCFFFTCAGVALGSRLRCMPGFRSLGSMANIPGGLVLLAVGIKILYEHGVFAHY